MREIESNHKKLLEAIKNTKIDDNYKPKEYKFGLRNFGEKKDKKIESQNDSRTYLIVK